MISISENKEAPARGVISERERKTAGIRVAPVEERFVTAEVKFTARSNMIPSNSIN
jgi:hypothetical protein